MERRNFIKISALTGVAATLDACHAPDKQLIRFIPEDNLIPGIAVLKPSVCTLCSAGCGLSVRVMQGDAEVVRHGKQGIVSMGLAKKLEGNPQNPVNAGKLCARGQAGLLALYHPDRITQPIRRSGPRGSGQYQGISWDDAIKELTSHLSALKSSNALAFLARPVGGQRQQLIEKFLQSFGAQPPIWYEPFDETVLRQANLRSFGHAALPTLDLTHADYLISFGADFLGTWNSPVAQSIGYGEMRRGRPGRRGKFVQVESRMSQTGANADEWIACRPGTEGMLALGIAHVILSQKLVSKSQATRAGSQIAGWSAGLPESTPAEVEKQTGVSAATVVRLAHEITSDGFAAAIVGGAPLAHSNGLFNALAVNALESLVDIGRYGGSPILRFTPGPPLSNGASPVASQQSGFAHLNSFAQSVLSGRPDAPQMLMLYDANPVYSAPPAMRIREAIAKVPYIVSFGSFIDETSSQADLILPDHAALESWLEGVPESGSSQSVINLAAPAVSPLHDTRPMTDVLLEVAKQLGGDVAKALPFTSFDSMLKAAFVPLRAHKGSVTAETDDDFWQAMQTQGGWWGAPAQAGSIGAANKSADVGKQVPATVAAPEFSGNAADFPFNFQPFVTPSFGDGSSAHLPWMQELPDVLTTAMWSSWVEINSKTGEKLGIQQGDLVEITSQAGSLRVAAVLSPGIAPDLLAMPVGQGHESFGRFASGIGVNPLSILAAVAEHNTGSLAWAATRVKLARIGGPEQAKLVLYAGGMSRFPHEEEPR